MATDKYDWIITSSEYDKEIIYSHTVYQATKSELGVYIRNHVAELFDHFLFMSSIGCDGSLPLVYGRVCATMSLLAAKGKISSPDTKEELAKYVAVITKNLTQFTDTSIVDHFLCYQEVPCHRRVHINQLHRTAKEYTEFFD